MESKALIEFLRKGSSLKDYGGEISKIEAPKSIPMRIMPVRMKAYDENSAMIRRLTEEDLICRGEIEGRSLSPIRTCFENQKWLVRTYDEAIGQEVKSLSCKDPQDFLEEPGYFREKKDGVYLLKDGKEILRITNIRVRIQSRTKIYEDENSKPNEELNCWLYSDEWAEPKTISVPISEYKNIYTSGIRARFPESYLCSLKGKDVLEMYLSKVYSSCKDEMKEEKRIMTTGWSAIDGNLRYVIGKDVAYKDYKFPDVLKMERATLFNNGFRFLEIGKDETAVVIPFIFAHFSYTSLFWERENHAFESVLFIRGETNSYKTAVAEVFCNVFQSITSKKKISFGSTKAALYATLSKCRDQTVLLDDYSCSEKQKKQNDTILFEAAIRAVGDTSAPSKMSLKDSSGIDDRNFRATLVITGEDDPGLSSSSHFRMITVQVGRGSYDKDVLRDFQTHPEFMREYMALFIEFLRVQGNHVIPAVLSDLQRLRSRYESLIEVGRVRDATINLILISKVIRAFAAWCGCTKKEALERIDQFEDIVIAAMLKNQEENGRLELESMFVYALMQSLGTRDKLNLAETEERYITNESNYIGFKEERTDTIWVRCEDVEQVVKTYWEKQGENFSCSPIKLKKILFEKGISVGRKTDSGKVEYVKRAKLGHRKRMLVLKKSKIDEIADGINKGAKKDACDNDI